MGYNPDIHHRRSLRLADYDYRDAGAYFVTICAYQRACLFGEVADGTMRLNDAGRMVQELWESLPSMFPSMRTEHHVVMPNHFHGIISIINGRGEPCVRPPCISPHHTIHGNRDHGDERVPGDNEDFGDQKNQGEHKVRPYGTDENSLGRVIQAFKSLTTHAYIEGVNNRGWPSFPGRLWQRNYYEYIIRNEKDLANIRQYITENPLKWDLDENNPVNAMNIP